MKNTSLIRSLLTAACVLACTAAHAQVFDFVNLQAEEEGQGVGRVGAALVSTNKYYGSEERRTLLLPFLDYRWANGFFAGVGNGVGYRFRSSPQFQYGVRLSPALGRDESESPVLAGMGDIDTTVEASGFFNYFLTRDLSFKSTLSYGGGNDHDEMRLDLGLSFATHPAPLWVLVFGVAGTYVNASYMQERFGVTPEQSARTGYAVSELGAGLRDLRASVTLIHIINREWSVSGIVTASSLQGDARDSVIVRDPTPLAGLVAVSYRF